MKRFSLSILFLFCITYVHAQSVVFDKEVYEIAFAGLDTTVELQFGIKNADPDDQYEVDFSDIYSPNLKFSDGRYAIIPPRSITVEGYYGKGKLRVELKRQEKETPHVLIIGGTIGRVGSRKTRIEPVGCMIVKYLPKPVAKKAVEKKKMMKKRR